MQDYHRTPVCRTSYPKQITYNGQRKRKKPQNKVNNNTNLSCKFWYMFDTFVHHNQLINTILIRNVVTHRSLASTNGQKKLKSWRSDGTYQTWGKLNKKNSRLSSVQGDVGSFHRWMFTVISTPTMNLENGVVGSRLFLGWEPGRNEPMRPTFAN